MTTPNALLATKQDSTTWHSGINILDDANSLHEGISSGSWIASGLSGFGTGVDAMAVLTNPAATLVSYGLNFLIEHVKPLQDALNWFAGDAGQVSAYGGTWQNVSTSIGSAGTVFADSVRQDTAGWTGQAADNYRSFAQDKVSSLTAAATASKTIGTATQLVGSVVGTVRGLIRDLVTQAIGQIVQTALGALFVVTIPAVVARVVTQVVTWMRKISDTVRQLITTLTQLQPLMSRLGQVWSSISRSLSAGPKAGPTVASEAEQAIDLSGITAAGTAPRQVPPPTPPAPPATPPAPPVPSKDAAFAQHEAELAAADKESKQKFLKQYILEYERGRNYRSEVERILGPPPADGNTYVAHHTLPVANHGALERAGFDTTNPIYGTWVEQSSHSSFSDAYGRAWDTFLQNNPQPSQQQVLDFGRGLANQYGYQSPY
jgi:hypothetical protein